MRPTSCSRATRAHSDTTATVRGRSRWHSRDGWTTRSRELNEGWTADWPFPAAYAADTARVRYLAGDYERSLGALQIAVRGAERLDPQVADLVSAVAAHAPRLRLRAVRVALGGGTTWQRLRNAAAVAAAR